MNTIDSGGHISSDLKSANSLNTNTIPSGMPTSTGNCISNESVATHKTINTAVDRSKTCLPLQPDSELQPTKQITLQNSSSDKSQKSHRPSIKLTDRLIQTVEKFALTLSAGTASLVGLFATCPCPSHFGLITSALGIGYLLDKLYSGNTAIRSKHIHGSKCKNKTIGGDEAKAT